MTTTIGDVSKLHLYQRSYHLKFLRKTGTKSTYYSSELNMHFENKSALGYLYEIETCDVKVALPKGHGKAEDFNKKINYRYNWIQANVNLAGKATQIANAEYLTNSWQKLKASIHKEYEGKDMEAYLKSIDNSFETEEILSKVLNQYFYFGLLFPCIPASHPSTWKKKRIVEISEYEEETFEESLTYKHTDENGSKHYDIKLSCLPESNFIIEKSEGSLLIASNTLLPESAEMDITYQSDDITSEWSFKLNRME